MKTYKALLYTGRTDTEAYKHHLFAVVGAIMLPDLNYLPNPTTMQEPHTLDEVKEATEMLTSVRTNGNGVVEWVEVDSYEAFKREWLNIVGREFK